MSSSPGFTEYINRHGAPTFDHRVPAYNFSPGGSTDGMSPGDLALSLIRAGNYAGAAYGGGKFSPGADTVDLTAPCKDLFDAVARTLSIDYQKAAEKRKNDTLTAGKAEADRMYHAALSKADAEFVSAALQVHADNVWGEAVRMIGIVGLSMHGKYQGDSTHQTTAVELASRIADVFGSQIGRALGTHNPFQKVTLSVTGDAGAYAARIGGEVATSLMTGDSLQKTVARLEPTLVKLGEVVRDNVARALANVVSLKLVDALAIDGVPGRIVGNGADLLVKEATSNFITWAANGFKGIPSLLSNISASALLADLGGGVLKDYGTKFGRKVATIDSLNGEIGAAIGTIIAYTQLPIPGLADFIGTVVGRFVFDDILDDVFGIEIRFGFSSDRHIYYIATALNENGLIVEQKRSIKNYDARVEKGIESMFNAYRENINAVINNVGGRIDTSRFSEPADFGFSHHDKGAFNVNDSVKSGDLAYLTKYAIERDLRALYFLSGDMVKDRALQHWKSVASGDLDAKLGALAPIMTIAEDYRFYMENMATVNALMAVAPDSAFTVGWTATLLQAKAMGLDNGYSVISTAGNDTILTADGADTIQAGNGNDTIKAFGGNDIVSGGAGDDDMDGGGGDDTMSGGAGNDVLFGGDGNDVVDGGDGVDSARLDIPSTAATVVRDGKDLIVRTKDTADRLRNIEQLVFSDRTLTAGEAEAQLSRIPASLRLTVASRGVSYELEAQLYSGPFKGPKNSYSGTDDREAVQGTDLSDFIQLNGGNDTVTGGGGGDMLYGNLQSDMLYGNQGDDTLFGGQDQDTLFGGQNGDALYGNLGNDVLYGNLGADALFGGQGTDTLHGGQGNDWVYGNNDADMLAGNLGDDVLIGGAGADTLSGGGGADHFRVDTPSHGGDVIIDFTAGEDKIALVSPNFGSLPAGSLAAGRFSLDSPKDADDLFVFNTKTGQLFYDADGAGAGAAVAIATLNVRTLSASDILVLPS